MWSVQRIFTSFWLTCEGDGTCMPQCGPPQSIQHYRYLHLLGHLARMPVEWLPKRALFGHMDGSGVRGRRQKQWVHHMNYVRADLQLDLV